MSDFLGDVIAAGCRKNFSGSATEEPSWRVLQASQFENNRIQEVSMNERRIGIIVVVSLLASAGWVAAAGQSDDDHGRKMGFGPRPMINFDQADINGDGQVTKQELQQYAQVQFATSDKNQDGFLESAELAADMSKRIAERLKQNGERMISKLDENGDDKLSFDEINNRMAKRGDKMFDRMDRNDDGTLSADELARMEKRGKHKWHKSDNGHDND